METGHNTHNLIAIAKLSDSIEQLLSYHHQAYAGNSALGHHQSIPKAANQ